MLEGMEYCAEASNKGMAWVCGVRAVATSGEDIRVHTNSSHRLSPWTRKNKKGHIGCFQRIYIYPRLTSSLSHLSTPRKKRTLADRNTAALGIHSRRDVHGREFLEQQLGGVGQDDARNLRLVPARSALVLVFLERPVKSFLVSPNLEQQQNEHHREE